MNREQLAIMLVIMEIVGETSAVSGHLYAAVTVVGVTFEDYTMMLGALVTGGLVTVSGHVVRLTPEGRKLMADVAAARVARKAGK